MLAKTFESSLIFFTRIRDPFNQWSPSFNGSISPPILKKKNMTVPAEWENRSLLRVGLITLGHILSEHGQHAHHPGRLLHHTICAVLVLLQHTHCVIQCPQPVHTRLDEIIVNLHLILLQARSKVCVNVFQ